MKARTCGILIASLAIVFVVSLTVSSTLAYMTDSGSLTNDFGAGTMPATSTVPPSVCKIIYDANGGLNPPAEQTAIQGETLALSSQAPSPDEGFLFEGWATDSGATQAQYQPGEDYTVDENVVLYAVWKQ